MTCARLAANKLNRWAPKFVDTGVSADGTGGYARELTADEKAQQAEKLAKAVAAADVVITTAAIPGKKAPIIITKEMVATHEIRHHHCRHGRRIRGQLCFDTSRRAYHRQ